MGWTNPKNDWASVDIPSFTDLNIIANNLRYLKGLDGAVSLDSGWTAAIATAMLKGGAVTTDKVAANAITVVTTASYAALRTLNPASGWARDLNPVFTSSGGLLVFIADGNGGVNAVGNRVGYRIGYDSTVLKELYCKASAVTTDGRDFTMPAIAFAQPSAGSYSAWLDFKSADSGTAYVRDRTLIVIEFKK